MRESRILAMVSRHQNRRTALIFVIRHGHLYVYHKTALTLKKRGLRSKTVTNSDIFALDLWIPFHHFVEFLGVPRTKSRHANDAESVGSHIRHLVGNVEIHPMNKRGDGDQCRRGEDNS